MTNQIHLPLPTTTIIASQKENPYMVAIFRSTGKHGNKLVLPGGRVKVGQHNWLQTGIIEAGEELGIKNLENPKFFCLCSNPNRDIRNISIEKFLDGKERPADFPDTIEVIGHYTFDVVITAQIDDQLIPDASEAKEASFIDVRGIHPEEFALDHGHILVAYCNYLDTGVLPSLDQF